MPCRPLIAASLLLGVCNGLSAAAGPTTFVDERGVWRWSDSQRDVALYGVNYTTPFAHAFRAHRRLGISPEKAIDADVYHFARLGFDAYRVHVWDREISDADGNLLANEHVRAFDYLVAKLKERGIKIVLTPLQFGNAGYPEAGLPLPGFSSKYGKRGCLEDRESWPLQERYLAQFASHVNPHTGLAYKDDPDVIAFEICNEPGHFDYAPAVEYINRMTHALRGAGVTQPVFYNMSHGLPVFEAYLDANIQGGTFQWYPANLLAGHEQWGNFLPYLDHYPIPFAQHPKFKTKAKLIYEFDPADLGRSYTYPAMARTFRKIGAQFAAQFAYDPMFIAAFNTEYQTHYLNLAYAPQKALSMMIAAEAFRRIPLFTDFGRYPENTRFNGVRVSYEEDLAELVTEEAFFHTNDTSTRPPAPSELRHVAGYGNSPIVHYAGRGAYFLDRVQDGVWRLEVMPDAIWVRDPFEPPSPTKQVSRIGWNDWPMQITLDDLGPSFRVIGVNDGNSLAATAVDRRFNVRPGTYLLGRPGQEFVAREAKLGALRMKEFVAPPASIDRTYVLHRSAPEASAGRDLRIMATVAAPEPIEKVELIAFFSPPPAEKPAREIAPQRTMPGGGNTPGPGAVPYRENGVTFPMTATSGFDYTANIPGAQLRAGTLRYHLVVHTKGDAITFPSGDRGLPANWDFHGEPWTTRVVAAGAPVLLFDAAADVRQVTADYRDVRYELVPSDRPGTHTMEVVARDLARGEHDHSFRFFFKPKLEGRTSDLPLARRLVMFGRSATERPCRVQLALVTASGAAYGGLLTVPAQHGLVSIPLDMLKPVRMPNIPHGYPAFIPFWSEVAADSPLDVSQIESILVSIGPGIPAAEHHLPHGLQLERIWLE